MVNLRPGFTGNRLQPVRDQHQGGTLEINDCGSPLGPTMRVACYSGP